MRVARRTGRVGGVLVHVGDDESLGELGLDVLARAAVAVSAGANFEVEGTVDLVLLGSVCGEREGE